MLGLQLPSRDGEGSKAERFSCRKCVFAYQDEIEVTVEVTTEVDTLFLSAHVGELSREDDAATLRHLMQLGFKGTQTGGGSLALDATGRGIVLWIAWPVRALDPATFQNAFGAFLDTASELHKRLKLALPEKAADDGEDGPDLPDHARIRI